MNREEIKNEYITGFCTFKELAEKYGASASAIRTRAAAEKWTALRKQYFNTICDMVKGRSTENCESDEKVCEVGESSAAQDFTKAPEMGKSGAVEAEKIIESGENVGVLVENVGEMAENCGEVVGSECVAVEGEPFCDVTESGAVSDGVNDGRKGLAVCGCLEREMRTADRISELLERAVSEQLEVLGKNESGEQVLRVDLNALSSAAKILKQIEDIKRSVSGLTTIQEDRMYELKAKRMELELKKAADGGGEESGGEFGVIVLPEVACANDVLRNDVKTSS